MKMEKRSICAASPLPLLLFSYDRRQARASSKSKPASFDLLVVIFGCGFSLLHTCKEHVILLGAMAQSKRNF